MEAETSELVLFFGRFHPLILHLPIGFLTLAVVLEILSRMERFSQLRHSVGFTLVVGCFSAIITSILGYMLAFSGGYEENLLFVHQWTGIGVAVISAVAVGLRQVRRTPVSDRLYILSLILLGATIAVAGHYGGSLTHGSDYLTKYMPDGLRKLAGLPAREVETRPVITVINEAIIYRDVVEPIFRSHCTSCHSNEKRKGDLMMHNPDDLMKGGKDGVILVPGDAENSSLIKRIQLPEDHDDHMPPAGKSQVTEEQLELLTWWIDAGAPFDKTIAELGPSDDIMQILEEFAGPSKGQSEVDVMLNAGIQPVGDSIISSLRAKGVSVSSLSSDVGWLDVHIPPTRNADSLLAQVSEVSKHITWLNLGGTSVSDSGLAIVATFPNLTRLHLGNTAVTDKALSKLEGLTYLESLNLYGTRVSNEGISRLSRLKNLKNLYLWQTQVTREGAAKLSENNPKLRVHFGIEVTSN